MPAEWQVYKISSSPFFIFLWDACGLQSSQPPLQLLAKLRAECFLAAPMIRLPDGQQHESPAKRTAHAPGVAEFEQATMMGIHPRGASSFDLNAVARSCWPLIHDHSRSWFSRVNLNSMDCLKTGHLELRFCKNLRPPSMKAQYGQNSAQCSDTGAAFDVSALSNSKCSQIRPR